MFKFLIISIIYFTPGLMAMPSLSLAAKDPFESMRKAMVERDIKGRGISDKATLSAMLKVKRHLFVPKAAQHQAYSDHPLPIGYGQTISQPYIVALMTEKLEVKKGDKVLEIGTGSGYQAAVLAETGAKVWTIEIIKELSKSAGQNLKKNGYGHVEVKHGDGYYGWKEAGPFDAVIVTAAANHIPPPLLKQLKEGGRLIIPLGSTTYYQTLTLVTKKEGKHLVDHISGVIFVPMTGKMLE
ncbi:MAG: protein-L-isoaspartate(D-aspartate) O-methyltransferase [Deltaproteobacteria bacterium]|nr:protein-L-isoaspartate(D-aspartate) O-methyltransferase [Deltaproteobacteria bacterium]